MIVSDNMSEEEKIVNYMFDCLKTEKVEAGYFLIDLLFTYNMKKDKIDAKDYFRFFPSDFIDEPIILYNKIQEVKPKNIIDVGVHFGLSTRVCLVSSVDIGTKITSCDIVNPKMGVIDFVRKYKFSSRWYFRLGSDIDIDFLQEVRSIEPEIVLLDSNHEAPHVLTQLNMYSQIIPNNATMFIHDSNNEGVKYALTYWLSRNNKWDFLEHKTKLGYTEVFKRNV